jgi:hypothetical protein
MILFKLPPDHVLEGQFIAPLFGLEVFVELFHWALVMQDSMQLLHRMAIM